MLDMRLKQAYSRHMDRKNHGKQMSQPERALWRDVLVARLTFSHEREDVVRAAADKADEAVAEYRKRITWKNTHD